MNLCALGLFGVGPGAFAQFRFEFANYWIGENEGSVRIAVFRDGPVTSEARVGYATTNVTAKAGPDYTVVSDTLTFAPGERVRLIDVPVLNNGQRDVGRTFRVGLSAVAGEPEPRLPRIATVNLVDNDPGIQFVGTQHWVRETDDVAVLTVTRGNDLVLDAFAVDFATVDLTAVSGRDYVGTQGTLMFDSGVMSKSIEVPIVRKETGGPDRRFRVRLERSTGGLGLGPSSNLVATVTITDTREMRPHRLLSPGISASGFRVFDLGGGYTPGLGASNRFVTDFDIVPIEVSSNLVDWAPLTWLVRTNRDTNRLTWTDPQPADGGPRFYRTPEATFPAVQRPPSGPYPVGFTDRVLVDPERRNRFRIATNNTIPITIWYPARRLAGRWPSEPYHPEAFARDPRPGSWEGTVDRAPFWKRYALRDVPFAGIDGRAPVVIWSSGHLSSRLDCQEWAEHLASYGYVVAAADHRDCAAATYPDGRYIYIYFGDLVDRNLDVSLLEDRVRDTSLILDTLGRWNESDPIFAGKVDAGNAGAIGWSLGGGTAVEFSRRDARVRAAVSLDGFYANIDTIRASGVPKPVMSIHAAGNTDTSLFGAARVQAVQFRIQGTVHGSFSAYYWEQVPIPADRGREAARTVVDYSVWFLDRHLKGSVAPIPRVSDYPKVTGLMTK